MSSSDYAPLSPSPMNLEFLAGSLNGSMQCVNITIMDDDTFERDETFTVRLTVSFPDAAMEGNDLTTVTIVDDEGITEFFHFLTK